MTIFGPGDTQRYVEDALGIVPPGKTGALVAYTVREPDGRLRARVVVATRVGDHWQLGGYFQADRAAGRIEWSAGMAVRGTW